MKKIASAVVMLAVGVVNASAADLSAKPYLKAPLMAAAAPSYGWTGCYVGIEGGGNWGRAGATALTSLTPADVGLPFSSDYDLSGGLVGGTVGCNYQVGRWVIGIEGDGSWTNKTGSAFDEAPFDPTTTSTLREKWFDTLRGRVGYAWDRVLIFGTGGGAFAGTTLDVCTITAVCASDSQIRTGWVAGGGIEFSFWDNFSLKVEYLHADFGRKNYFDPPLVTAPPASNAPAVGPIPPTFHTRGVPLTDDVIRVGLNYHFGSNAPVVAKY